MSRRDRVSMMGVAARGAVLAFSCLLQVPAQAALFSDDEARKAILDLRQKVDVNRQDADSARQQLAEDLKKLIEENAGPSRRGMLELVNQLEQLRSELARLRGQNEQLAKDLADVQRQQKDVLTALDERLRVLEPIKVSLDGREFLAEPAEKAAFEAAMNQVRQTQFAAAVSAFQQFMVRYPESGYAPAALYWRGNAQYALRDYKPAIESYTAMIARAPDHVRAPDALLAIGNCQLELKDGKAAKRTLGDVVKNYPQSDAAGTARDRLSRLK